MNEFLTPLYWNFGPLFFCKLLQVIQIWRMPSPNCCFEISSQVLYGSQIWTHCWPFRTLQRFVCNHFWVLFEVCFGSLSCWKTHDLWWRRSFLTLATMLHPQDSLVIIRFHDTVHTVKASSARSSNTTPKHLWTSTMFDCRDCVLFFEVLISFSVNSAMMSFTKKLYFCLICPQYVLPEGLWFCHISFGKLQSCFFMHLCQQWCPPGSPTIASLFIQMATDSASWHCCTQICLNLFGS